MKKVIVFSILITGIMLLAANDRLHSQNNPDHKRTMHWYFGDKAGLDFSSGHPVADITGQMGVLQGSATISDTSGNLLFYTDGRAVWNRNNDTMINGRGLGVGYYSTPEDCSVIIPKPGDNNIYYIFTVDGWENQFKNGLRYHVVDMTQDGGLGAVVQKNIQLFTPCTEQLSATKDSSKCGYWVASHELHTANFRAYHVTSAGVDTVPVISAAGIDYNIPQQYYNLSGGYSLKFTPNGYNAGSYVDYAYPATHLSGFMDILKFNKGDGKFSSVLSIPVDTNINASFGFSPNSKYLYYEDGYYLIKEWQTDISSGDSATILNSKTLIRSSKELGIAQDWQIGYDGKIYMGVETNDSLSVINNPNEKGTGCGLQKNVISLDGRNAEAGLPRFVTNFLINDTSSICTGNGVNELSSENNLLIYPNPANKIIYIKSDIAIKQIKITNILGVTIFKDDNFLNKSDINCQTFTDGIYIIQITTLNHKFFTSKLIINH